MKLKDMKGILGINKIFMGIMVTALIIGGAIYFGLRESAQTSEDSQITELQNQLASLQEQLTLLIEEPIFEELDEETEPEPTELEEDINPCDYLNCDELDGWNNSGSTYTCQDGDKICTCRKQIYHNYACSSISQKCVYSTTDTRVNKYSCVEPETQYPDLIIQSPGFSPAMPVVGNEMFFWATLKNQGEESAASSLSYLRINGVKIDEFLTPSLASNESIVVTWATPWSAVVGQHELEICADGALQVSESNELNNCAEMTFTVADVLAEEEEEEEDEEEEGEGEEEEEETISQPDLIIESLSISPASTTAGQTVHFSGTVKNQGEVSAASSLTRLSLDFNNDGTWYQMGAMSTSALEINGTATVSWQETWTATAGTHKFEICADSAEEVSESDETNNCFSRIVTIP